MIGRNAVRLATRVYRLTPNARLRRLYFRSFSRLMKQRIAVETIDGNTLVLDLGETIDLAVFLKQFEVEVAAAITHYCREGWTALDIGANIGAHTLTLGRAVGNDGRVFAFEPDDYAFQKLNRNLSLNPKRNVIAFQVALSDRNIAQQRIELRANWPTDGRRVTRTSVVNIQSLDCWSGAHGVKQVDLIKLDIDGDEFSVLNGARELISRSRPIVLLEVVGPHFEQPGKNPLLLLKDLGYRFWDLKSKVEYADLSKLYAQFQPNDVELTFSKNLIASTAEINPFF